MINKCKKLHKIAIINMINLFAFVKIMSAETNK